MRGLWRPSRTISCGLWVLLAIAAALPAAAQGIAHEGFEGPTPSLQPAGSDAPVRMISHRRQRGAAFEGQWCESLQISAQGATHVFFAQTIASTYVIDEVVASLWLKSDRAGLQILARAVLPRAIDPKTDKPLTVLVRGSMYQNVEQWQKLVLDRVPARLEDQLRILRTQYGSQLDSREAYIDQILINAYGGAGVTSVWIDQLEIEGAVVPTPVEPPQALQGTGVAEAPRDVPSRPDTDVLLRGTSLLVNGRPFFPRAIQHQGESFARLKQLGFNTVWLDHPARLHELAEAKAQGLLLISPPPQLGPRDRLSNEFSRMLAWDLGWGHGQTDLKTVAAAASQLSGRGTGLIRPSICNAVESLGSFSRKCDIMISDRSPLGSSLDLRDYATWLKKQGQLAQADTPTWTTVQTEMPASWFHQTAAFDEATTAEQLRQHAHLDPEQIRLLAYTAISAGMKGLLFRSQSPLDQEDPATRLRAKTLELLNLELGLIENWPAAGAAIAPGVRADGNVEIAVMRIDRARLMIPLRYRRQSQYPTRLVAHQSVRAEPLRMIVPGIPESNDVYQLTVSGLTPLEHRRVTGGTEVVVPMLGDVATIVYTQDPAVVNYFSRSTASLRRRIYALRRELVSEEMEAIDRVMKQLVGLAPEGAAADLVDSFNRHMVRANRSMRQGTWTDACDELALAQHTLRALRGELWKTATRELGAPSQLPPAMHLTGLPLLKKFAPRREGTRSALPPLVAEGFDDLGQLHARGWRHVKRPTDRLGSEVRLSTQNARFGSRSLHLRASDSGFGHPPVLIENPPVWVTSPEVVVQPHEVVEIRGHLHVPRPVVGSIDGLMIVDSAGGTPLAHRVGVTRGWEEFRLFRAADASGKISVSFLLTGIGEAWIDGVTIRRVPAAAGMAPLASPEAAADPRISRNFLNTLPRQ